MTLYDSKHHWVLNSLCLNFFIPQKHPWNRDKKFHFTQEETRQRTEAAHLYIVTQKATEELGAQVKKKDPNHHTLGSLSWEDTRLTMPPVARALSLKKMTFGHFQNRRFLLRKILRGKQKWILRKSTRQQLPQKEKFHHLENRKQTGTLEAEPWVNNSELRHRPQAALCRATEHWITEIFCNYSTLQALGLKN